MEEQLSKCETQTYLLLYTSTEVTQGLDEALIFGFKCNAALHVTEGLINAAQSFQCE